MLVWRHCSVDDGIPTPGEDKALKVTPSLPQNFPVSFPFSQKYPPLPSCSYVIAGSQYIVGHLTKMASRQ